MNMLFKLTTLRPIVKNADQPTSQQVYLTRTFVETGHERCPITGIWSRLDSGSVADDPGLALPVMRRLLLWRAFHTLLTIRSYSLA